jgi:hypothetical protein
MVRKPANNLTYISRTYYIQKGATGMDAAKYNTVGQRLSSGNYFEIVVLRELLANLSSRQALVFFVVSTPFTGRSRVPSSVVDSTRSVDKEELRRRIDFCLRSASVTLNLYQQQGMPICLIIRIGLFCSKYEMSSMLYAGKMLLIRLSEEATDGDVEPKSERSAYRPNS